MPVLHLLAPARLIFACVLATSACAQSPDYRNALGTRDAVDASVAPGDDFFAYANADWLKSTEIPAGKGRWGAGSEITEQTRRQVARLLEDARAKPPGTDARKVADFRAAYLNEAAIEARGLAPVKPLLDRIERINDRLALTRYLGSELRADVDPTNLGVFNSPHILGLAVQAGLHGEKDHVAYLLQGGLGLPDREQYLAMEQGAQVARDEYRAVIERILARLEIEGAQPSVIAARADAVMLLETRIARSHATAEASAEEHNADTLWSRADFAREAPGMDWNALFEAGGLPPQQAFVAWQPSALKGAAELVASQPLQAWKDYLRVRVIHRYAPVLPQALGGRAATSQAGAREQAALDATQAAMGESLGRMYVERHFPPEYKARVQGIVANVIAAFTQRLEGVAWMTPAAKAVARAKLKALYFGVGYPDRWQDYSDLMVDATDPVGNLRRAADRDYRRALARLGQPVDRTEWPIAPQWPGAILTFNENAYSFAAALLQPPKFDPSASDAQNYGAIGAIVGHEVSHFVDTLGANYGADGGLHRWWSDDDMVRYGAATEPLVRQFSDYSPLPGIAVDGKRALTENLADLGGLAAAHDAFRRSLGEKVRDKDFVRGQDRQFFIGFARSWRAKYRDDALKTQAASDHAPERYRISTVRNIDAWYEAFDVKPGQRLYLEPSARVRIW
jgi:putative endopeptidase